MAGLLNEVASLVRPRLQPGVEVTCSATTVGKMSGARTFLKQVIRFS